MRSSKTAHPSRVEVYVDGRWQLLTPELRKRLSAQAPRTWPCVLVVKR